MIDGNKIKIWTEPWLQDSQNSYIVSPHIDGLADLTVSSLIHSSTATWNETLIHDRFVPLDVTWILSMPIYPSRDPDKILWKLSKDGMFSVRSAYYYAMENMTDSFHLQVSGNWKDIWNLKTPLKMNVFLWRVSRGCLPTREKLISRGVECPISCPYSVDSIENDWYIFAGYPHAKKLWLEASLLHQVNDIATTVHDMIYFCCSSTFLTTIGWCFCCCFMDMQPGVCEMIRFGTMLRKL